MITGPFLPAAASWIWAAVPATPVELTLPETDPSSATVMVPLPAADVVTGGTSLAPDSATLTSAASAEPAANPPTNMAAARMRIREGYAVARIMGNSLWGEADIHSCASD